MKPIEIHIEGYKIVISKDEKESEPTKEKEFEKITYVPYPVNPTSPQKFDWWEYPYVTCTHYDETNLTNTNKTADTPVRDCMVGKVTDEDA